MHTTPPSLLIRIRDPADQAAWREFDARYREWLTRFFRRRGLSAIDSEDLTQQVFAGLFASLPKFMYEPVRGRFRDYLYRCARNAICAWRNCPERDLRALIMTGSAVGTQSDDPAAAQIWEEEWVNHHYRLAIATLRDSASERDIAILERSMAGASVESLVVELNMEIAAVYKARQRIRDRMEALIAAQIADEDRTDV